MTNWSDDYHLLGLGELTSLIKSAQVSLWGTEVLFECLYNPENPMPYVMAFQDCREIRWNVHDPEMADDNNADLFGISLGKGNHYKPAILTTDIFEVSILYGCFILYKGNLSSFNEARQACNISYVSSV